MNMPDMRLDGDGATYGEGGKGNGEKAAQAQANGQQFHSQNPVDSERVMQQKAAWNAARQKQRDGDEEPFSKRAKQESRGDFYSDY